MDSTSVTASTEQPPELPIQQLARVLQHLDLHQCLGSCSLVSKTWNSAATAATTSIKYSCKDEDHAQQLVSWLAQHGQCVTSLALDTNHEDYLYLPPLPCSKLKELEITGFCLELLGTAHDQQQKKLGLFDACAKSLTQLKLSGCHFEQYADSLCALKGLTNLRHLHIGLLVAGYEEDEIPVELEDLPNDLWCHLQQLTHLSFKSAGSVAAASFDHFSCLTGLKELHLDNMEASSDTHVTVEPLTSIQHLQQLTSLQVKASSGLPFSIKNAPLAPQRLSGLQRLELSCCDVVQPALLEHMTQLQRLDLAGSKLPGREAGTAELLAVLPKLQRLQYLDLSGRTLKYCAPSAAAYSALTASSQLQYLGLSQAVLPASAWSTYMFPAGRQLPQLEVLLCSNVLVETEDDLGSVLLKHPLDCQDLERLVQACPALEQLYVHESVMSGEPLTALAELSALTSLSLSRVRDTTAAHLAEMKGLMYLSISGSKKLTLKGVMHTTHIPLLFDLDLSRCGSRHLSELGICRTFKNQAKRVPDVAWQVMEAIINKTEEQLHELASSGGVGDTAQQQQQHAAAAADQAHQEPGAAHQQHPDEAALEQMLEERLQAVKHTDPEVEAEARQMMLRAVQVQRRWIKLQGDFAAVMQQQQQPGQEQEQDQDQEQQE